MHKNIFEDIATMRMGMKLVGYSREEIEQASREVMQAKSHDEALSIIKKYWC